MVGKFIIGLVALVLQVTYLSAVEKICRDGQKCYSFGKEEGTKIILIGIEHSEESAAFEMKVIKAALSKDIVSVQESLSNDKASSVNMAKIMGYRDSGYLFGMEDPLANCFVDLILEHYVLHLVTTDPTNAPPAAFERADGVKMNILNQLYLQVLYKELWRDFVAREGREKLSEEIIATINTLIESKAVRASQIAYARLSKDGYQWLDFFKYFGIYVLKNHIAELPEERRPNIEKIEHALLNPSDLEGVVYIGYDVCVHWRDIFIKENIRKGFEFAKGLGKPLFVVIGQDHFKDIEAFLEAEGWPIESHPFNTPNTEEKAREFLEKGEVDL